MRESENEPSVLSRRLGRRLSRHKRALAVSAGLAVLAGVVVATNETRSDRPAETGQGTNAQAQPAASSAQASSAVPGPTLVRQGAPKSSPANDKRVAEMKGKAAEAAKNNVHVQRVPAPVLKGPIIPDDQVTTVETGDMRKDRRMLRVVSARGDLTGQRSLGWVVGEGEKVGGARCTQSIKLSNNPKPKHRPTLLLCWRTSAKRSVYTILVDLDEPPSKQESVAALEKTWSKLG